MIAGRVGAINIVMHAMDVHMNNPDVCEQGCKTLKNIAFINCKTSKHQKL